MRTILLIPLLMVFALTAFAQAFVIGDVSTLSDHLTYKNSDYNSGTDSYYDNIDGSPYLNDEFSAGEVIINDSLHFENVPLRYNVLNNKMQFINDRNQILEIDNMGKEYRYIIEKKEFISCDYRIEGEIQHGILEELVVEGEIKLYKKYSAKFKPATKAIGFQEAEPDRIIREDDIYLLAFGNAIPENITLNKKSLFKSLEFFKKDIEQYARKENLKLRSEEDLIRLIRYCNE